MTMLVIYRYHAWCPQHLLRVGLPDRPELNSWAPTKIQPEARSGMERGVWRQSDDGLPPCLDMY